MYLNSLTGMDFIVKRRHRNRLTGGHFDCLARIATLSTSCSVKVKEQQKLIQYMHKYIQVMCCKDTDSATTALLCL